MDNNYSNKISAVISFHFVNCIAGYKNNLLSVLEVSRKDWFPAENDERIEVLAQYLAENGDIEIDNYLLRYGLTVPGQYKGIIPPLEVLDEHRGGFSKPRIEAAAGQVVRVEEGLRICRDFFPALAEDTETAINEIVEYIDGKNSSDVDIVGLYNSLAVDDVSELVTIAIDNLNSSSEQSREIWSDILQRLSCFRFQALEHSNCEDIAKSGLTWPASIYRDGGDQVAEKLLEYINNGATSISELNQLLLSLAWTRSDRALEAVNYWEENPPSWVSQLFIPPSQYLHWGGWCKTENVVRRDLVSTNCFRLSPDEPEKGRSVQCLEHTEMKCPSCNNPLSILFDFSEQDLSILGADWSKAPKKVLTCLQCSCYEPVFSDYTDEEVTLRKPVNGADEEEEFWLLDASDVCFRVSKFPPFAVAEPFVLEEASTLGGVPMWLQDAEYPSCPDCGETMQFLAQFDNNSIDDEGIYYAFFCGDCQVSAVSFQQT